MAYKAFKNSGGTVNVDLGDLNPKQKLFCQARTRYVAYGGASGSSSLLAHSADELYFGESLILGSSADVVLPASLPVYRNSLLDAADNTDAMKARLRTVLDALGLDTTLADTAITTCLSSLATHWVRR